MHIAQKKPRARKDVSEFGPGRAGFFICPSCKAVYSGKRWHHDFPKNASKKTQVRFQLCPACRMAKEGFFEGEVIFKDVPRTRLAEVLQRIKHVGEQAFARDVLDRILSVQESRGTIIVRTSENQLALRIAKITRRILKGKLDVAWSEQEDTARIVWRP